MQGDGEGTEGPGRASSPLANKLRVPPGLEVARSAIVPRSRVPSLPRPFWQTPGFAPRQTAPRPRKEREPLLAARLAPRTRADLQPLRAQLLSSSGRLDGSGWASAASARVPRGHAPRETYELSD